MSDSLRPHGLQPTRVLHPWDFPVKRVLEWGAIAFSSICIYIYVYPTNVYVKILVYVKNGILY